MTDFEKFRAVGQVRQFAENASCMVPIGQKVRILGTKKSVDIDVAKYIQLGMKVQTVCKWLQFIREVVK